MKYQVLKSGSRGAPNLHIQIKKSRRLDTKQIMEHNSPSPCPRQCLTRCVFVLFTCSVLREIILRGFVYFLLNSLPCLTDLMDPCLRSTPHSSCTPRADLVWRDRPDPLQTQRVLFLYCVTVILGVHHARLLCSKSFLLTLNHSQ